MKRTFQLAVLLLSLSLLMPAGWAESLCAGAESAGAAAEMQCPQGCPMMAAMARAQSQGAALRALHCEDNCSVAQSGMAGITESRESGATSAANGTAAIAADTPYAPANLLAAPPLEDAGRSLASPPQQLSTQSILCNFRN